MNEVKLKQTEIGEIPENWKVKKIRDVAKINELSLQKSSKLDEINYIDIASVNVGKILEINKMSLKDAPSRAKRIVRDNDIIISTVRPNLKHYAFLEKVKSNTIVSTGFAVITANNINPQFLYYYLTTNNYISYLTAIADTHTSAYPSYNPDVLEESNIPFPPRPEQDKISKILAGLDKKIILNLEMNKALEAIGQSLFKHWFIDFECPNEEGKPYKSSGGEMVYSEELKKEIPKGWRTGKIEDLCTSITNGGTPKRMENIYWDDGKIPWYKTGELFDGPLIDSEEHITEDGLNNSACKPWEPDTILIALYASPTVGRLGILKTKGTSNQACSGLVAKNEIGYTFLFYSLLFKRVEFNSIAVGSAQQNISQQIVKDSKVIIPNEKILDKFNKLIESIFDKRTLLISQSSTLSQVRDALLPKLMSGQIRIPIEVD